MADNTAGELLLLLQHQIAQDRAMNQTQDLNLLRPEKLPLDTATNTSAPANMNSDHDDNLLFQMELDRPLKHCRRIYPNRSLSARSNSLQFRLDKPDSYASSTDGIGRIPHVNTTLDSVWNSLKDFKLQGTNCFNLRFRNSPTVRPVCTSKRRSVKFCRSNPTPPLPIVGKIKSRISHSDSFNASDNLEHPHSSGGLFISKNIFELIGNFEYESIASAYFNPQCDSVDVVTSPFRTEHDLQFSLDL